jgi:S1-C subfamily serine protease
MIHWLRQLAGRRATVSVAALVWALTGGTVSAEPEARWLSRAVVSVIAYDEHGEVSRTGAGLLVAAEGFIATNHHVVEGASRVTVEVSSGHPPRHATILYSDPRRDLAILSGAAPSPGTGPIVEGSDWIDAGEPVLVLQGDRMPGKSQLAGQIAGSREDDGAMRYIYIQTDELPSAELGARPIVNQAGSLIGLSIGVLKGSRDLVSAMPVSDLRLALARARATAASTLAAASTGVDAGAGPRVPAEADPKRWALRAGVPAPRTGTPIAQGDIRLGPGPDLPVFPSDAVGSVSVMAHPNRARASVDAVARWVPPLPPLPGPMPAEQIEMANRIRARMTEIARTTHKRPVFQLDPMTQTEVYFQALREFGILE